MHTPSPDRSQPSHDLTPTDTRLPWLHIQTSVWYEFLVGLLLVPKGEQQLLALNPLLTPAHARNAMDFIAFSLLFMNRIGQTRRCINAAAELVKLMK
ncbi:hypothetical protein SARC_16910, partial [Sphaeroforma arctica JP610]